MAPVKKGLLVLITLLKMLVSSILIAINFSFQNFSIKHFPLPLPSQKIALTGVLNGKVHFKTGFEQLPV